MNDAMKKNLYKRLKRGFAMTRWILKR